MITEALTSYLNIASKEEKTKQWYKENKEAIDAYNKEVEEEGLI
ncbi:type II toxin-antitoxin system CcdA family antitoxin [Malaciobacter sp. WC5094]